MSTNISLTDALDIFNKTFGNILSQDTINELINETVAEETTPASEITRVVHDCSEGYTEDEDYKYCPEETNMIASFAVAVPDEHINVMPSEEVSYKISNSAYKWADEYVDKVIKPVFGDALVLEHGDELVATLAEFMCWSISNKL